MAGDVSVKNTVVPGSQSKSSAVPMKPHSQPGQKSALRDAPERLRNRGMKLNQCRKCRPVGGEIQRKIVPEKMAQRAGMRQDRTRAGVACEGAIAKMAYAKESRY